MPFGIPPETVSEAAGVPKHTEPCQVNTDVAQKSPGLLSL